MIRSISLFQTSNQKYKFYIQNCYVIENKKLTSSSRWWCFLFSLGWRRWSGQDTSGRRSGASPVLHFCTSTLLLMPQTLKNKKKHIAINKPPHYSFHLNNNKCSNGTTIYSGFRLIGTRILCPN